MAKGGQIHVSISIGRWAYLVGLVVSILAGFVVISSAPSILFIVGLLVGLLNVSEEESHDFLVAVLSLVVVGLAGSQVFADGGTVSTILANFVAFASASALVVALRTILGTVKK